MYQQLFVKYNIHFSGVSRSIFETSKDHIDGQDFADLVSQIGSMSFDSTGLHWRYAFDYLGCIFVVVEFCPTVS